MRMVHDTQYYDSKRGYDIYIYIYKPKGMFTHLYNYLIN